MSTTCPCFATYRCSKATVAILFVIVVIVSPGPGPVKKKVCMLQSNICRAKEAYLVWCVMRHNEASMYVLHGGPRLDRAELDFFCTYFDDLLKNSNIPAKFHVSLFLS